MRKQINFLKNLDVKKLNKKVVGTCHPKNDLSFATRDRCKQYKF